MTNTELLTLLEQLQAGINPITQQPFPAAANDLRNATAQKQLGILIKSLSAATDDAVVISDETIKAACADLRALGYEPTVPQLAKIFIGSRAIADHSLKGLSCYRAYRGVYGRQRIHTHLVAFSRRFPLVLPETNKARATKTEKPWKEVDFFRTPCFDQLEAVKSEELKKTVTALGLTRATETLPAFQAVARERYPRAFEPWTREEHALLIEAMCYTNDPERLAAIFGRSARAIEGTGQRLIWDSQQRRA